MQISNNINQELFDDYVEVVIQENDIMSRVLGSN